MNWWLWSILLGILALGALGVFALYRSHVARYKPPPLERNPERPAQEQLDGFMDRQDQRLTDFMRRVGLALLVLAGLLIVSLAINVTLWGAQREDDKQQSEQVDINRDLIKRMDRDLRSRRTRAAATDRQQCQDIEKLKSDGRKSIRQGIRRLQETTLLSPRERAGFLEDAQAQLERLAPRRVTTKNGEDLVGVKACTALPNSEQAG